MSSTFAIHSGRAVISSRVREATVVIRNGKIAEILDGKNVPSGISLIDAGNKVLMSGIVDTHAHINEPGRTEWEGFQTATHAAAAGGITSIVDMPLNSIPATTSLSALKEKMKAASEKCWIDYSFWGGVIPGNQKELEPMVASGVRGFKCFLIDSGVQEFPFVKEADLREAMPILARAGVPLLVHAELKSSVAQDSGNARQYHHYMSSRPPKWEIDAIRLMIRLANETGCRTHIVHLSAADALEDLKKARESGVPISAETCPHYLGIEAEEIPDGATLFKCAPPIRDRENREKLWKGLEDGIIDFVVSDHSPCVPKLKELETGNFDKAWGGIAGLQFSSAVVWTEMKKRGMGFEKLSSWMSERTSNFSGLKSKGKIAVGRDADLVIWNPEESFVLKSENVLHRHRTTPYEGKKLYGKVEKTFLRGKIIYDQGTFQEKATGIRI